MQLVHFVILPPMTKAELWRGSWTWLLSLCLLSFPSLSLYWTSHSFSVLSKVSALPFFRSSFPPFTLTISLHFFPDFSPLPFLPFSPAPSHPSFLPFSLLPSLLLSTSSPLPNPSLSILYLPYRAFSLLPFLSISCFYLHLSLSFPPPSIFLPSRPLPPPLSPSPSLLQSAQITALNVTFHSYPHKSQMVFRLIDQTDQQRRARAVLKEAPEMRNRRTGGSQRALMYFQDWIEAYDRGNTIMISIVIGTRTYISVCAIMHTMRVFTLINK